MERIEGMLSLKVCEEAMFRISTHISLMLSSSPVLRLCVGIFKHRFSPYPYLYVYYQFKSYACQYN